MSLLEMICKELGVEVGEIWLGNNGYEYTITDLGELYNRDLATFDDISVVLTGELYPKWEPKYGETYYKPTPSFSEERLRYGSRVWADMSFDFWALRNNMIYKTPEQAIEAANKMLESIKEDKE